MSHVNYPAQITARGEDNPRF
uniref:Uncharacterized protein n=1 Tax=Anguilla anguilla TaxID=7936 RepID=A0A0E9RIM2_ANGAN